MGGRLSKGEGSLQGGHTQMKEGHGPQLGDGLWGQTARDGLKKFS